MELNTLSEELSDKKLPQGSAEPSNLTIVRRSLQVIRDGEQEKFNWNRQAERIIRKYEEACSTADPDELEGGIRFEEKTLFNMVKKAVELREAQEFDVTTPKAKAKARKVLREIIFDVINRVDADDDSQSTFVRLGLMAGIPDDALQQGMLDETQRQELKEAIADEILQKIDDEFGVHDFLDSILQAGTTFALDRAGYYDVMKSPKDGVHYLTALLGDALMKLEKRTKVNKDEFPIFLRNLPPSYVFWNMDARSMRTSAYGQNVNHISLVYNFANWETFLNSISEEEKKNLPDGIWGGVTVDEIERDERESDEQYFDRIKNMPGQMVYAIDLLTMQTVKYYGKGFAFGGTAVTGSSFPFKMKGKEYINIFHFIYLPSARGFTNFGMGHYAVQPHNRNKLMNNALLKGALADVNAPYLANVQEGKEEDFMLRYELAEQQEDAGRRGVVINSIDDNGHPMVSGLERFTAPFNIQILEAVKAVSDEDQIQVGLRMFETDTPASKTKFALQTEGIAARSIEETAQEYNAGEFKFFIEAFLDLCKEVKGDWDLPMKDFITDSEEIETIALNLNWQDFVKILKAFDVDARPAITQHLKPSQRTKAQALQASLQYAPVGSVGSGKILQAMLSEVAQMEVSVQDFVLPESQNAPEVDIRQNINQ